MSRGLQRLILWTLTSLEVPEDTLQVSAYLDRLPYDSQDALDDEARLSSL